MNRARRYIGIATDVLVGVERAPNMGKGVLVLGMHRSGTSAIAGVIGRLGLAVGDPGDLIAPNEANQKGYWENRRLTQFQESLLEKLGGSWEAPPALKPNWERDRRLVRRLGLARRTFRDVYGETRQWVWKDPRTALLMPFWRRALRFDPVVVGIFRNPLEVADSLVARDGIPKKQAFCLWETYNRALLGNTRGLPAFLTSYEDLVSDPVTVARGLSTFLERQRLTVRRAADDVSQSFLDADLRHHVHTASEADTEDDMSDAQCALLRDLRELRGEHLTFPTTLRERLRAEPQVCSASLK